MIRRTRTGLLPALGLTALTLALLALAGCSSGGSSGGATTAANAWARAIQGGDQSALSEVLATDYRFDGVDRADTTGAGDVAPGPGFMGREGEVTVEVVDVTENGAAAVAHIKVTYTGFLGALVGGDAGGGWGNGVDSDGDAFADPGIAPPAPPDALVPGESETGEDAAASAFRVRSVEGKQLDATPLIFTGFYELNLEQIDGVWAVVAQRQVWTQLLVGDGAQAPVIDTLLGNGSPEPTVDPRAEVSVTGTVRATTDTTIAGRIGYIQSALTVDGTAFSGTARAPRVPGGYALEVRAINESADGGAYGISTRSIPLTVRDAAGAGFQFSVASGVSLPSGVEEVVRGLSRAAYNGSFEAAQPLIDPAYRYNGFTAESAPWTLPFSCYGESDLAVTVTASESLGASTLVTAHFRQEADNYWYYGYPVDGGSDGSPGSQPDADVVRPMLPPHLRPMAERVAAGARDVTSVTETMVNEGDFTVEIASGLVTAIRPVWTRTTNGSGGALEISALTGNGSDAPSVAGGAPLAVAGGIEGLAQWGAVYNSEGWADFSDTTGPFAAEMTSPFVAGRWLTTAYAGAWTGTGSVYVTRTLEVTVTVDAPTPTFTAASGVTLTAEARATLDNWLAGLFLASRERLAEAYDPAYSYDGRNYDDVLTSPRLSVYHADVSRAEVVSIEGPRATLELEFTGPWQWFGVPYYRIGEGDGAIVDGPPAPCTDADGYTTYPSESHTVARVTLELGATRRIVAERIDRALNWLDGNELPMLSDLRIDGAVPGVVAAGASVTLSATAEGTVDTVSGRLGPSTASAEGTAVALDAPAAPGRYLAELVAGPQYWATAEDEGARAKCIPYYGGSMLIGAEVTVQ